VEVFPRMASLGRVSPRVFDAMFAVDPNRDPIAKKFASWTQVWAAARGGNTR